MQQSFMPDEPEVANKGKKKKYKKLYQIEWWTELWPEWTVWKKYKNLKVAKEAYSKLTKEDRWCKFRLKDLVTGELIDD